MSGQAASSPDNSTQETTSVVTSGAQGGMSGAAVGGIIGAVAGTGLGVAGALISANSQNQIDQEKQALEDQQAAEVLQRERTNDALRQQNLFKSAADISSESAASGHEGAGIGSQLELKRQADLQTAISDQEATFQAGMLEAGATMQGQVGNQAETAGYIGAASTVLGGVGRVVNPSAGIVNYGGSGAVQSLPAPGESFSLGTNIPSFT